MRRFLGEDQLNMFVGNIDVLYSRLLPNLYAELFLQGVELIWFCYFIIFLIQKYSQTYLSVYICPVFMYAPWSNYWVYVNVYFFCTDDKYELQYQSIRVVSLLIKFDDQWFSSQQKLANTYHQIWCNDNYQVNLAGWLLSILLCVRSKLTVGHV